jgi:hypothetical protein
MPQAAIFLPLIKIFSENRLKDYVQWGVAVMEYKKRGDYRQEFARLPIS